jgi:hypothetical protein
LRQRVEALVRALEEATALRQEPCQKRASTAGGAPATGRPGTVIGQYRLLGLMGEGGMGLVFVAAQRGPVRREVARKVLKPGRGRREVIARFEAERQALALFQEVPERVRGDRHLPGVLPWAMVVETERIWMPSS